MARKKTTTHEPTGTFGVPARRQPSPDAGTGRETLEEFLLRRHIEWREHQIAWRFFQDSYEGGGRYRNAIYGLDHRGLPVRNLIRHKREYPNPRDMATTNTAFQQMPVTNPTMGAWGGFGVMPGQLGSDAAALATDDPYEYRRARTPVPRFVGQAINMHLSCIFGREVTRDGPDSLKEWWKDVDGCGTSIDDWIRDTVGPLLLVCGSLDIVFDHPENRSGVVIETVASQKALGLDRCVASYILPDNMLWWELDQARRYTQCLVREYTPTPQGGTTEMVRHWTATESSLYDLDGELQSILPHGFGKVPIVRLIGVRKFRCENTGQPEYEEIADIQREFYNRDSELVLSDSLQAHPLLQAPEEYCKADGEVSIGPDYLLPKKRHESGGSVNYEGFEFIEPPKGAADSLRTNKNDLRDAADRSACLAKPAGTNGNSGQTVSQSGTSKSMDAESGNKLLARRADQLARCERLMVEYVLLVQNDRVPTPKELEAIEVCYPKVFDLGAPKDLADTIVEFQGILSAGGEAPVTEGELLCRLVRLALPGESDEQYEAMDDEIELKLQDKAKLKEQQAEAGLLMPPPVDVNGVTDQLSAPGGNADGSGTTPAQTPGVSGNPTELGSAYGNPN